MTLFDPDRYPDDIDFTFWVEGRYRGWHGALERTQSHTARGRFNVYWLEVHRSAASSIEDLAACSPMASVWLDGFLCGNEPDTPPDLLDHYDEAAQREWDLAIKGFRLTGRWPDDGSPCEVCGDRSLPSADLESQRCSRHFLWVRDGRSPTVVEEPPDWVRALLGEPTP